jgi:hypothetical protein
MDKEKKLREELISIDSGRRSEILDELAAIEEEKKYKEDQEKFLKMQSMLNNVDLILKFIKHGRTSCDDIKLGNECSSGYDGGPPRCNRCALLVAKNAWEENKEWISNLEELEMMTGLVSVELDLNVIVKR